MTEMKKDRRCKKPSASEQFQKLRLRNSQLKMGENIAILFIFILLVVFGMVFFFRMQTAGMQIKQQENLQLAAVQIAQRVSFLPELRCSSENVVVPNCYDALKMEFADEVIKDNEAYYYDIFEFSTIWVEEAYPEEKEWLLYNNTGNKNETPSIFHIPISIYDPMESSIGNYYFGVLHVGVWR
jgi:hypothetical protein